MAKNYSDLGNGSLEIEIGTKKFKCAALTLGDLAQAETFIKSARLEAFLNQTRLVKGHNLPDNVRGVAIGSIMNTPVSVGDILGEFSGQLYILYMSLKRGGTPLGDFDSFKATVVDLDLTLLMEVVAHVTKLNKHIEDEKDTDSPLDQSSQTFTIEKVETFGS